MLHIQFSAFVYCLYSVQSDLSFQHRGSVKQKIMHAHTHTQGERETIFCTVLYIFGVSERFLNTNSLMATTCMYLAHSFVYTILLSILFLSVCLLLTYLLLRQLFVCEASMCVQCRPNEQNVFNLLLFYLSLSLSLSLWSISSCLAGLLLSRILCPTSVLRIVMVCWT